jgi:glutathione S-transferase
MAIVENPRSDLPAKLRGLHLFHYGGAPCAQRVRLVLAEKGIRRGPSVPWQSDRPAHLKAPPGSYVSRPVSLPRQQNLTAEYAGIHPHLVVPALVYDGVVHIESVDIMAFIDEQFPGPSLVPQGEMGERCRALVRLASELQTSVRHVTYRFSLGGIAKLNPRKLAELKRIDAPDSPDGLAEFYRRFSTNEISEREYAGHVTKLEAGFAEIEASLGEDERAWLCGDAFSLADIIWAVKVFRIDEAGYPIAPNFPRVWRWFEAAKRRPAFREAILRDVRASSPVFRARGAIQNLLGRGLRRLASSPAQSA